MTTVNRNAKYFAGVPAPIGNTMALQQAVEALKSNIETLTMQNAAAKGAAAVTWNDLLALGLITQGQMPT